MCQHFISQLNSVNGHNLNKIICPKYWFISILLYKSNPNGHKNICDFSSSSATEIKFMFRSSLKSQEITMYISVLSFESYTLGKWLILTKVEVIMEEVVYWFSVYSTKIHLNNIKSNSFRWKNLTLFIYTCIWDFFPGFISHGSKISFILTAFRQANLQSSDQGFILTSCVCLSDTGCRLKLTNITHWLNFRSDFRTNGLNLTGLYLYCFQVFFSHLLRNWEIRTFPYNHYALSELKIIC